MNLKEKMLKRQRFLENTETLKRSGKVISIHNKGYHLKIQGAKGVIDCWPSTEKYMYQDGKMANGIKKMLQRIKRGEI